MAVSNWDVFGDTWVSKSGSNEYGSGVGPRLQVGRSSSGTYDNRFFVGFARPTSGANLIPAGAVITGCTVYLKVRADNSCFGRGSAQYMLLRRINPTSYTPNENSQSGECNLAATPANTTAVWPGPDGVGGTSMVTSDEVFWNVGDPGTGAVISKDITTMFQNWWAARAAGDNYFTVMFLPSDSTGSAEQQASARRGAYNSADADGDPIFNGGLGPYIAVTYTTATAPNAPTLTSPANAAKVSTPSSVRALAFTYDHPSGTAGTDYNVVVATSATVSGGALTTGIVVNKTVTQALVDNSGYTANLNTVSDFAPDEVQGTTYYWQVRTKGDGLWGAFSAVRSYTPNRWPVNTKVRPA